MTNKTSGQLDQKYPVTKIKNSKKEEKRKEYQRMAQGQKARKLEIELPAVAGETMEMVANDIYIAILENMSAIKKAQSDIR